MPDQVILGSLFVDNNACVGWRSARAKFEVNSGGADIAPVAALATGTGEDFLAFAGGRQGDQNPHIAWKRGPLRVGTATLTDPADFSTMVLTERLRITESGEVGIGTSAPRNRLDVAGGSAIGAGYAGTATAPLNGLLVEGRLGVGTTTPQNTLDVEGALAVGAGYSGTATAPANGLIVQGSVGIGTSSPATGQKLDVNGDIAIQGKHALRGNDAWLRLNQDGAFTSGVHTPGVFASTSLNVGGAGSWGNPGAGNVWITGNVGIGTIAPAARLEVAGKIRIGGNLENTAGRQLIQGGNITDWLRINPFDSFGRNAIYGDVAVNTDGTGSAGLVIGAWESGLGKGRLKVHKDTYLAVSSGNVGVGTTSPTYKLDVAGSARVNGSLYRVVDGASRLLGGNPARYVHSAHLFVNGDPTRSATVDIDLGTSRRFTAFAMLTGNDPLSGFDRWDAQAVEVYRVDGSSTGKWIHGGDHFGSSGSDANVHTPYYSGYGRVITFRIRTFDNASAMGLGVVFYE